jgi:GT2 family glycosyltransferase
VSVCVPIWKRHGEPNISTLVASLPAALNGLTGELILTLNGVSPSKLGIPAGARTVEFETNRGVSVGWNAAAACATGSVLCFTNDDVVFGPGSLQLLSKTLTDRPDAGVAGPAGTDWDIGKAVHRSHLDLTGVPAGEVRECDVVSGFLFATRREVFRRAGRLDEAYTPCGFEEVDYCTTVRLDLGLRCYAVAGVPYQHDFGISARRRWRRISYDGRKASLGQISDRNRAYFLAKWSGR